MTQTYSTETVFSWIDTIRSTFGQAAPATDLIVERVLRAAARDFPEDPRPGLSLGERLAARGAGEAALEAFETVSACFPAHVDAIVNQLHLLLRLKRFDEARARCDALAPALRAEILNPETAARFMGAAIAAGYFDGEAEGRDFDKLFFTRFLVSNLTSIYAVMQQFSERYFFDYIALAKNYVEASGARFIYVSVDNLFDVAGKTKTEKTLLATAIWERMSERRAWLLSRPPHLSEVYGETAELTDDCLDQIFGGPAQIIQATKIVLPDHASTHVNVERNLRLTSGAPARADRRVLLLGGSDVYGFGSADEDTIASALQTRLDSRAGGPRHRVENHGLRGNPIPNCLNSLQQTSLKEGDVVVMFGYPRLDSEPGAPAGLATRHVSFSRPHEHGEVFIDHSHVGPKGNRVIAAAIAAAIIEPEARKPAPAAPPQHASIRFVKYLLYKHATETVEAGGLREYLAFIETQRAGAEGRIGSIAVNCNPMTLGHLHLMEYAASRVDHLYLFVIEEDLSFFPFKDRLELVRNGTAHLPNVTVLRGGRYICTQVTFPEYFSKDEATQSVADASMEAWFFCEYIAKALGISVIFLGDEPNCVVTRSYNARMAEILPNFGVEVDIIPRISKEGAIISASTVRRHLAAKDFIAIRAIVPRTTYDYLRATFGETADVGA